MANGPVAENYQLTSKKRKAITSQPIDQPIEARQAKVVNEMDNPEFAEDLIIGGS